MKTAFLTILVIAFVSGPGAPAQAAPLSVLAYGAACDGSTDDTAAFQQTAAEANRIFVATRFPASIVYVRTCVLKGTDRKSVV